MGDEAPHHRPVERARKDGVDLMDTAGGHRPAALAALLAQVVVEGIQGGGVQPAELELANCDRIERSM
jgi:transposase